MSFADCIRQNPALSDRQREKLINEYDQLVKTYTRTMGDAVAAQVAAKKIVEIKEAVTVREMENAVRDVVAWQNLKAKMDDLSGKFNASRENSGGLKFLWGNSTGMAARQILEDTYTRQMALERRATMAIAELIEKYRSKHAGLTQDAEGFRKVVDEILGKDTGDAVAKGEAKAIREVMDVLHKQYEDAGGIMGKLENYYPQSHNAYRVHSAGFEEWANFIRPLLDRERMINELTGLPHTDAELDVALRDVFAKIESNGLIEVQERAAQGKQSFGRGGGIAKRHRDSRFLHFKDADSFMAYNSEYGFGDAGLFHAMMGHVNVMTRDIALLQSFGPNPDGQIARIEMQLKASGIQPAMLKNIRNMFDVLAGRLSSNGVLPLWYRGLRGLQDWMRSSYLGGAPVSAMTDSYYAAATAKYNGLPATKVMGQYFSMLNPASARDRQVARRMAFIAGSASGNSLRQARMADDYGSRGVVGWMASFTNRASGLGAMTDAAANSVVLSTQGFMAEARASKLAWADLPPAMREAFERWDMNEVDYNNIISSRPFKEPEYGGDFMRPEDVAIAGHLDTARKYEMWMVDMSQSASNEPRLLTRAITTGGFEEGTVGRAAVSSLMMFKSFGITVVLNHMLPALRHMATQEGMSRFSRIAPMMVVLPILGAAAIQSRQVLYGKTQRDMNNPKFWLAASMQGGGFGIFGDFMFTDFSRFNQDFVTTMGGPVAGFLNDGVRVFNGNFNRALDDGQETKFAAQLYQMTERNIPAVKLWYSRLLLERLMLDQLERAIDPTFDTRIRRQEQRMKKELGQKFWWRPGAEAPL